MPLLRLLRRAGLLALGLGLHVPPGAPADEAPAKAAAPKESARGKWVPLFQKHASEYVIAPADDPKGAAKMLPKPVLRWWQPVRGGDDGALYLWTKGGRPVAAMTFFTFKWPNGERAIVHEHHALATEPLEASWNGRPMWHTTAPGVTFRPVPGGPAPADAAPARLRQMQAIVREFTAVTTDDKGSTWPQRALTKPLYRFEGPADGALFAFAQGTDPEAFLLLEVRPDGKSPRWHYALARFTDLKLAVRYKNAEVFSAPSTLGGTAEIYRAFTVIQKPSDRPEDFEGR